MLFVAFPKGHVRRPRRHLLWTGGFERRLAGALYEEHLHGNSPHGTVKSAGRVAAVPIRARGPG